MSNEGVRAEHPEHVAFHLPGGNCEAAVQRGDGTGALEDSMRQHAPMQADRT
jgi:hypothetical protein